MDEEGVGREDKRPVEAVAHGGIQAGRLRGELLQTSLFHFTPITFRAICTSKALNRIGFGRP